MKNISVGLADDHTLFREGIRMIISQMPGISLNIEASSGEDLLDQLKEIPVDVILLDIEMKKMTGIDVLNEIKNTRPEIKVIMLSMYTEPRMISHAMEMGANGYLKKDAKKAELEQAIRSTYETGFFFNESVSLSLLTGLKSKSKKMHSLAPVIEVSSREKEVLHLICQEFTTREIGEKLFISDRTVEGHRKNLCAKLEVKNTAGLVKKAILLKLIDS